MQLDKFFSDLELVPNMRGARFTDLEVSEWSEGFRFEGLAAVFDETMVVKDYSESVERGAFRKALAAGDNVPMFYDHSLKSDQVPLATTAGGTMRLREVPEGLQVEADVADTQLGRDVRVSAKRGDIRGMSYGFVAGRGNTKHEVRGGTVHRRVLGIKKILDVSPTWDPAYKRTTAEFRSLAVAEQLSEPVESLQQLLTGVYAQLEERVIDEDESEEHRSEERTEETPSGVSGDWQVALAARKRRLAILTIQLGGDLE